MNSSNTKENHTSKNRAVFSRMVNNVPTVGEDALISEVAELITSKSNNFETIIYVYVLNNMGGLAGVMSVKEVFSAPKERKVSEFMKKDYVSVYPHSHQERAAMLAIKYNVKAIPVIDKDRKFLGVIPSDVILNILHEEHIEDALRSGGFTITSSMVKDIARAGGKSYFKKRLPWLIFGLGGGLLAAYFVGYFEDTLKQLLTLAAFVPAIVYMGDAVGTQTQTVLIRSLAAESTFNFKKYIVREILVGVALAAVLGIVVGVISFVLWEPMVLGVILGFSFFITIISAVLIALFLPLLFLKLRFDPAIASGPFATTIRDLTSVIIYLEVATFVLGI
ncbi:MAG: Mg2+ transporter [Candidatus Nomurabacteria bacterium GW2011_GWB1_37_5]|uniref:Mg2+ transporter n=1 Tax=Candidatus Nomurabacteria bacterium GW2011_GWB1_37_5 TaxID=1618742 RepID=A0A0G0K143_9BACT|nr:MAG: Mg2+ transporter [Candidatus Nomurabacteria bacterium GW2011_GWB1_37_5]